MNLPSENLIITAESLLNRSDGDVDFDYSGRLVQQSIAYSLLAIAKELHRSNEERELEHYRQERLAGSAFAE
jgi:hypothetical protein